MMYPWEMPMAPFHIATRQPVMEIKGISGVRRDLPMRREKDVLSDVLRDQDFGIVVMTHRGSSNGRLSILLSSIPENYKVLVSSDSIDPNDVDGDHDVAFFHGANFTHCTPWGGRATNAIHAMKSAPWSTVLYLCDDVWLFPETVRDSLRWFYILIAAGVPLACLGYPGWETYHHWKDFGFSSWEECLEKPWMFEAVPPNPAYMRCPALYKNPFGACMMISKVAYLDLGGFSPDYWAHDDVFNHKIWTSGRWVSAAYPGRGYMHLGAQSWHHGESQEYVGSFKAATGYEAEESGKLQVKAIYEWMDKLGSIFKNLGGTPGV